MSATKQFKRGDILFVETSSDKWILEMYENVDLKYVYHLKTLSPHYCITSNHYFRIDEGGWGILGDLFPRLATEEEIELFRSKCNENNYILIRDRIIEYEVY